MCEVFKPYNAATAECADSSKPIYEGKEDWVQGVCANGQLPVCEVGGTKPLCEGAIEADVPATLYLKEF